MAIADFVVSKTKRILVAEDDIATAHVMALYLTQAGYNVIGVARTLQETMAFSYRLPDAALLDIDLGGRLIWPAAEHLAERGVPVMLLATGGKAVTLPPSLQGTPLLNKPVSASSLITGMQRLLRTDLLRTDLLRTDLGR